MLSGNLKKEIKKEKIEPGFYILRNVISKQYI